MKLKKKTEIIGRLKEENYKRKVEKQEEWKEKKSKKGVTK